MADLELFAGTILVLAVAGIAGVIRARIAEHGLLVLIYRWCTGLPHHGRELTDRGWLRPGTRALTPSGHASRLHHLPRWRHTLWRTGPLVLLLALGWGLLAAPAITLWTLAGLLLLAVALATLAALRAWRRRRHRRQWIEPLHVALAPVAGVPVENAPGSWIEVAADRSRAVVTLPKGWAGKPADRDRLAAVVCAKLGMEAPEVRWDLTGPAHQVVFTVSEPPPHRVTLADVQNAIDAAKPGTLVVGLGRGGKPVCVSLESDSPHVAASMGSGAGKSSLARALLAAWLHSGGIGLVLDAKIVSHPWAWQLPNCAVVDQPASLHDAFCWLAGELDRRNQVAKRATDVEGVMRGQPGPPLLVIAEELNLTLGKLRQFWEEQGQRGRSPAIRALDSVMFAGRQAGIHVVQIAQMLTTRAAGSGEARENAGIRIIARATLNNWKMLAPEHPYPGASGIDGRVHVVASGRVRECQVTWLTMREARQLALSGVVTPVPAGMPGAPVFTPAAGALPAGSRLLTLSDAIRSGLLSMSIAAVRTARHRDPRFPRPAGTRGIAHTYRSEDLADWMRSR